MLVLAELPVAVSRRVTAEVGATLAVLAERHFDAVVVRPPEHSYLEDGHGISLPDAVMMLDVGKLLVRGPALA